MQGCLIFQDVMNGCYQKKKIIVDDRIPVICCISVITGVTSVLGMLQTATVTSFNDPATSFMGLLPTVGSMGMSQTTILFFLSACHWACHRQHSHDWHHDFHLPHCSWHTNFFPFVEKTPVKVHTNARRSDVTSRGQKHLNITNHLSFVFQGIQSASNIMRRRAWKTSQHCFLMLRK